MTGTALEKFAHLASHPDAQEVAEAPTPQAIVDMLAIIADFDCLSCETYGLSNEAAARKKREFDCAILAEIATHLPNVPNTRANADFLRHHLNGHKMNTLEGKKAMWELVGSLPKDSEIRKAFLIPSPYDDDLSDPKIMAIPREEYILPNEDIEFDGDTHPIKDYRAFQFPELS